MYKIIKSVIIFLLFSQFVFSQSNKISIENCDCENAIELSDTIWGPTNPPIGFGKVMEISDKDSSIYYFEKEHNTTWYKFTVDRDCELYFDIIPISSDDDYDFILFKYSGVNFCSQVRSKEILPVRSNISRNDKTMESKTGLSDKGKTKFVNSGLGNSYSIPIDVKSGETYYLVLDNVYENGKGHSINFYYRNCEEISFKENIVLNINIIDKETGELLNGNINISEGKSKLKAPSYFQRENISSCYLKLRKNKTYVLNITSDGYFSYYKNIITKSEVGTISIKAKLSKIEVGNNILVDNLYFYGGTANFLPTSYPVLRNLLMVLKQNPTLKIEIQGHVNQPYNSPSQKSSYSLFLLSKNRAVAVYDYLIERGINKNRLKYKGFSNTQMVYPYATSAEEQQKNRRVEIKILEK